jgi:hypothetical protein
MLQYYKEYEATSEGRDPSSRFVGVWNGLVNRTTTQADDLPAILAAMMDCSAGEVLEFTPQERMKALLKQESSLPLVLFYQPTGLADGHWTPKIPGSDERQTLIHPMYGSFKVTERGLVLENVYQTWGFVLDAAPDDSVFAFLIEGDDNTHLRYVISQEAGTVPRGQQRAARTFFLLSNLCAGDGSNFHGARFSIVREESEEITIQHEAPVLYNCFDDTVSPRGPERVYTNCKEQPRLGKRGFDVILDIGT